MKRKIFTLIILIIIPFSVNAVSFNKDKIISNNDLTNSSSLSLSRIQSFLNSQGGYLANYTTKDIDGVVRSTASIIYNACQKYLLNPKFMLVTLQKESSLVTKKEVSESLLDKAFGFGCPDGGSCSSKYKGFAKQVDAAGNRIRNGYLDDLKNKGYTVSGWAVNQTKQASDGSVTPQNEATAVLYTYTPWIGYHGGNESVGGNSLFWDIWNRWFIFSEEIVKYPNGSLLQSRDDGIIYVIKENQKNAFTSLGALMANYNINKIITVEEEVLDLYDKGINILFPNYTLLQAPNGAMYLYVDGKKRGITSREIFRNLGYNPEEAIPANWDELNNIPEGGLITEKDIYPGGILAQNKQTGAIVFINERGKQKEIWSKEIMETRFKGAPIFAKDQTEIEKYEKAKPIKFRDGELVTSPGSNAVYVIDNGRKRPFKSAKVFEKLGYSWGNIIHTSDVVLSLHEQGKTVTLKKKEVKTTKKKK